MKTQILLATGLISALTINSVNANDMMSAVSKATENSVKETANNAASEVKKEAMDKASDMAKDATSEVKKEAMDKASDMAKDATSEVKKEAMDKASDMVKGNTETVDTTKKEMNEEKSSLVDQIVDETTGAVEDAQEETGIMSSIFSFFK